MKIIYYTNKCEIEMTVKKESDTNFSNSLCLGLGVLLVQWRTSKERSRK